MYYGPWTDPSLLHDNSAVLGSLHFERTQEEPPAITEKGRWKFRLENISLGTIPIKHLTDETINRILSYQDSAGYTSSPSSDGLILSTSCRASLILAIPHTP